MKNRDFSIPITLGGQAYFLRHDYNSICTLQKTLGLPLTLEVIGTTLFNRACLFAMLGRVTRLGKFVHLNSIGEVTLEDCGDFFDSEPQGTIQGKISEAFKAASGEEDPDPNAAGLAKNGTGEVSSDLPAAAV